MNYEMINNIPLVSLLIIAPIAASIFLIYVKSIRAVAFLSTAVSGILFGISILLPVTLFFGKSGRPILEQLAWMPTHGIKYSVMLDGINVWLFLLTLFIGFVCIFYAGFVEKATHRMHYIGLLLFMSSILGCIASADLFLFIFFLGMSLAPPFMIQSLSEGARKQQAALREFLFNLTALMIISVAFITIYMVHSRVTGVVSFDWNRITQSSIPVSFQHYIFWLLFIGFAIRAPLFPFHSWFVQSISESPVSLAAFMMCAGIKIGLYGFMRFSIPICPDAAITFAPIIVYISLIGIIYGALIALVQPDIKKLIAFSSFSQMGFVMLGTSMLSSAGFTGSILHMVNHGVALVCLFLLFSWLINTSGSRLVLDHGGIIRKYPAIAWLIVIAGASCVGMPGLNCFPGLFLIIKASVTTQPVWSFVAITGFVLSAAYMLWLLQRTCFGKETAVLKDLKCSGKKSLTLLAVPLVILMIFLGLYPRPLMVLVHQSAFEIDRIIQSRIILHKVHLKRRSNIPDLEKFLSNQTITEEGAGDGK